MKDLDKKALTSIFLTLVKSPIGIIAIIVIFSLVMTMCFSFMLGANDGGSGISDENLKGVYVKCTPGKLDQEKFHSMFDNAGVFTDMGIVFQRVSTKHQIDPVLLSAIAFNETGRGTSKAVKTKNNPGGLMNPKTGSLFVFDTLEEGIDKMASNLYRLYISQGLLTIPQIGNKYAPVGASNDPNNLNMNWVPTVTSIANDFGGLSMNCTVANTGAGGFIHPVPTGVQTSPFGYRIDPITGQPGELHKGLDYACSSGDPIYSVLDGNVVTVRTGWGGGYGNHVIVSHGDKYTLYAHMSSLAVKQGAKVTQGQMVGKCGTTGSSTGNHLHFEVQLSLYGQRIDPKPFLP